MLNSGKKIRALLSNETKNHNLPSPLQVQWLVPRNKSGSDCDGYYHYVNTE
jgi:hypothetical protein